MSKKITADLQEIQFKILFDVPEGYSCFTEKSQDKFLEIIDQLYNVQESGNGFGCFGVKIEVETPELINLTKTHIEAIGKTILKLEKIKPPAPPRKKDVYTTVFDLLGKTQLGLEKLQLNQVIYSDDRLYQTLLIEGSCLNSRAKFAKIKETLELTSIISDMVNYKFGDAMAFTFNKGLTFTEDEIIEVAKLIMSK
jgi:hypothetical protein